MGVIRKPYARLDIRDWFKYDRNGYVMCVWLMNDSTGFVSQRYKKGDIEFAIGLARRRGHCRKVDIKAIRKVYLR